MTAPKAGKRDLAIIAFTAFLNFTGLTLAIPIFTPLCLDQTGGIMPAGKHACADHHTGVASGDIPPVPVFHLPAAGRAVRPPGQKKNSALCHSRHLRGYIIMAVGILAESLPLAFLSRIITGGFSGSLAVTQSAIADLSDEKTRPKNFGLLGAAFGTSLFIGPALAVFSRTRPSMPASILQHRSGLLLF